MLTISSEIESCGQTFSHLATNSITLHFINKAPGHNSPILNVVIGRQAGDINCLLTASKNAQKLISLLISSSLNSKYSACYHLKQCYIQMGKEKQEGGE